MQFRSYNSELKIATAMFMDVFNNIVIDRRTGSIDDPTIQKLIEVPCVFGQRSRILKSLENPNKTLSVPMIAVNRVGFVRDVQRVHSIHNHLLFGTDGYSNTAQATPIPINVTFTLTAITRYIEDLDQIVNNFIPFFQPDIYVVWKHPKFPSCNIKSQVVWDGSVSTTIPEDLPESAPYRCLGDVSFTFKTWFFPGVGEYDDDLPKILKINATPNLIPFGEDGYMLDRWYDVPVTVGIDGFKENIKAGLIKADRNRKNWDWLPISGDISGYWQEISGAVSGSALAESLVSQGKFTVAEDGNLLFFSNADYLTSGMTMFDFAEWYNNEVTDKDVGHNDI
ncbi:MAG TPA: tail sheath stabilizer and completion protein [Saccharofermentans sp.]|nr:tail sheath stabilizer and completion protein [Saccharofermentans sp.]